MLVLTEAAAEVVKAIAGSPQEPEVAGLRIASSAADLGNPGGLQVSVAPGPDANDQVIDADGAHIYLEPQAAVFLEDKVLDAEVDSEGTPHFSLAVQQPGQFS
jgi:Fe-S cluster assembly iron-binding protein IscA